MIKFYGKFSEKCIEQTSKMQNKRNAIMGLFAVIIGVIITIIAGILKWNEFYYYLGFTFFLIILDLCILYVPSRSVIFRLPREVIINSDTIICRIEGIKESIKPKTKKISKIKKIIDSGDWYYITFKGDFTESIICQKNLIIEGTIEEFEELFKDKIIRKK